MDSTALGTAAVIAAVLVPLVSLIKKPSWSTEAKHMLGLGSALVAAIAGAVVDGHVNSVNELIPYLTTAFTTAQTLYVLYFSKTDLNTKLENK